MEDDLMPRYKSRSAASSEYHNALGQASFAFSSLEWGFVCIARRIKTDFITAEFYTRWTSGTVCKEFKKLVQSDGAYLGQLQQTLLSLAEDFELLVKRRNDFAHSQPITGPDGTSMLARYQFLGSFYWTVEALDDFTRETEELSSKINHILHHEMKSPA